MQRCRTCLYPNTKPDLEFDETGQCSACSAVEKKQYIDWNARHEELLRLLDKHHGRVIVPSSGGKDSTYQAIRLKELGADVTAVTARTCHLTSIGRANIDNLARHVRTVEVAPNMTVRAKLNRLGLEMVGDISWPEHAAIFSTPLRVAADLGISLVMFGECSQREYGGPKGSEEAKQMTRRWITEFGGFLGLRPSDFVGIEGITARDMADYEVPKSLESAGIEAHFLGAYEPWDSHRNAEIAMASGMQTLKHPPSVANWWVSENLDNYHTGVHDFYGWLKYGYGRGCAQISVDIRRGLISRNEALLWLNEHDGAFPMRYMGMELQDILDNINVSRDSFLRNANSYMNASLFNEPELKWGQYLTLKENSGGKKIN